MSFVTTGPGGLHELVLRRVRDLGNEATIRRVIEATTSGKANDYAPYAPEGSKTSGTLRLLLAAIWKSYLRKLQTDPVVTKSISAAIISLVSDLLASSLSGSKLSSRSLLNQFSIGLAIRGPIVHYFHQFLDRVVFARVTNQTQIAVVIAKVIIDQFIFSPPYNALYFLIIGLLEDRSLAEIGRKIRRELWGVMKTNWIVWTPANIISYYAIPLELRVLWGNLVGIIWTAILISKVRRGGGSSSTSNQNSGGSGSGDMSANSSGHARIGSSEQPNDQSGTRTYANAAATRSSVGLRAGDASAASGKHRQPIAENTNDVEESEHLNDHNKFE
ncbi:similar to peroxisomal membrane protein PMP22 [Cyanidioschyzon merolae strain 10D]|jgi:hypothetical protein|uniref:Similar to peroxisomal membrane protein PMP22 n=1 Tax=Cyanidioschyzon merolae (strain NIES-3377 / 10D) TaxID=280699 RepID=M1VBF4_CYAM1|nr:similar to peroxisomal membrane protein PMP22 [Cyanidioschyzon merolae strain 10D]BAM79637.1 similar to peroxisomal membrane protein PMP22 [Cyanidioschyzon merolae strain 10D]|eukprot:XP_005535923.1 similar to peroxisomal membrane protein PMP22 [Cyanidioschyzon merolae strain 10D]